MKVTILNVGTNTARDSLQLHLNVTAASTPISMSRTGSYTGGVYTSFRFKIINYKFSCNGFTKFKVTYRQGAYISSADHKSHSSMVTCPNSN